MSKSHSPKTSQESKSQEPQDLASQIPKKNDQDKLMNALKGTSDTVLDESKKQQYTEQANKLKSSVRAVSIIIGYQITKELVEQLDLVRKMKMNVPTVDVEGFITLGLSVTNGADQAEIDSTFNEVKVVVGRYIPNVEPKLYIF